eukprot:12402444-Karenia_brevis.AAC.1
MPEKPAEELVDELPSLPRAHSAMSLKASTQTSEGPDGKDAHVNTNMKHSMSHVHVTCKMFATGRMLSRKNAADGRPAMNKIAKGGKQMVHMVHYCTAIPSARFCSLSA